MTKQQKHWQIRSTLTPEADRELGEFLPVLRQLLYNRGYQDRESANQYLNASPPEYAESLQMMGIQTSVDRIQSAIRQNERIVVYGDYDADGVTATALLVQALSSLGAEVHPYIPDRFVEGYGLNIKAIESLQTQGTDLIITVDCGIRSLEEVEHARSLEMDLIISDHHHPGRELPHAIAIINPRQPGDDYPEKSLSGVGLAYKLATTLVAAAPDRRLQPADFLDLVALGTVADLVPLVGENRSLVRTGLACLRRPRRQGIQALIGVAGLNPAKIKSSDIGYILAPRLNAAGRLKTAEDAYRLLITQDLHEAGRLAQSLDNYNRERQKITLKVQEHAEALATREDPNPIVYIAADPSFNPGVVGLAASRLANRYYRPAVIAHQGETFTRGSCRSIPEFHITEALDQCADLLVRHGGHAAAAGFTVNNDNLAAFEVRFKDIVTEQLGDLELIPTLDADAEVRLKDLNPELLAQLDRLEPTGAGNSGAQFVSRNLRVTNSRTVGRENAHLKLTVSDGTHHFDAIAFRQGDWHRQLPKYIDLLYKFEANEFRGNTYLQLNVQDIIPSS